MGYFEREARKNFLIGNQQQSEIIKSDPYIEQEVPKLQV